MYPFIRLGKTFAKAINDTRKGKFLELTDTGEIEFISSPTDMDSFFEMNNGRILTLFDLGRNDLAVRTGLAKQLLKNKWGLVVAGSSIQYRKRVYVFKKVRIKTRLVGMDDKWIYIEQSMWVSDKLGNKADDKPASTALLRTGVSSLKTGKVIATQQILDAIGKSDFRLPIEPWVQAWADADKLRPWPPL